MFTGIVEEIGIIERIQRGARSSSVKIRAEAIFNDLKTGDSVSVNGVCLTVTERSDNAFSADVMPETLSRSSLGELQSGSRVNLERAMSADGRFGGHIVSGHIDGTGLITEIKKDDNAVLYTIKTSEQIMKYIIEKGSVALDGISLTVTGTSGNSFSVSVIPHTAKATTLSEKSAGGIVNIENDMIGKYVEKLLGYKPAEAYPSNITEEFLIKHGF